MVTKWLIGICVALFGIENALGIDLSTKFGNANLHWILNGEPYRLLTGMFLHGGVMHIFFNMIVLWQVGSVLERTLGHGKYLALYLTSGLAGALASAMFLDLYTISVGASGAIFGLMGAYAVIAQKLRARDQQMVVWIGINLVIGFLVPGIDWHAHIGGLIAGSIFASVVSLRR